MMARPDETEVPQDLHEVIFRSPFMSVCIATANRRRYYFRNVSSFMWKNLLLYAGKWSKILSRHGFWWSGYIIITEIKRQQWQVFPQAWNSEGFIVTDGAEESEVRTHTSHGISDTQLGFHLRVFQICFT